MPENDDEGEDGTARSKAASHVRPAGAAVETPTGTAALQIEVARHPQVALAALVHGSLQTVLQESHYGPRS